MTSRHTKASSGNVVSMLRPKHLYKSQIDRLCGRNQWMDSQSCNIDKSVVCGKVVEHVSLRVAAKVEIPRERHGKARYH